MANDHERHLAAVRAERRAESAGSRRVRAEAELTQATTRYARVSCGGGAVELRAAGERYDRAAVTAMRAGVPERDRIVSRTARRVWAEEEQ